MQLQNAPRCALMPMEFKYHLYWILAVRLHCSGSRTLNSILLPKIKPATGEKADAHCLFKLTVANDGQMPIKMYTELDLTFLGLKVPKVGVLIAEEPNQVLDKKHQTRLPSIIGWNLIQLSYDTFIKKYGTTGFDSFIYPEGVNPLLFSQLCIYHHSNVRKTNTLGATSEVMSQNI